MSKASVTISERIVGQIDQGLLLLVGIEAEDDQDDIDWIVRKVVNMRIFNDSDGKMNLTVQDLGGKLLVVSQFTLHASTKKGNRPSFIKAARPEVAIPLYEKFVTECGKHIETQTGEFGADMQVGLVNDGPVTIWLDSKAKE